LILYYGTVDVGNHSSGWTNSQILSTANVGNYSTSISGLSSGTTYYARLQANNGENSVWFGPISWTTESSLG